MKKLLVAFSLTLFISAGFAQEQKEKTETVTLTIDQAVEYALKNSRTLKSNDIDLEMKKRASNVSWNVFLPNVSLNGTMKRSNEISPSYAPLFTDYPDEESRWDVIGGASVSWNFTPAYIAKIQIAKANYEAGKISWEQSQNETLVNVKKIYYGLLLQQESLKIQKTTLENARQRMIQAEANFKSGLVPEISLLQTQVNYENTKPTVDSAEQTLNQQFDTFAFLIGLPVGTKIELTSSIEPQYVDVTTEDLLNKYADNDLQIQSMKKNMETAKLGITALDLSTWIPTFALSYGWTPMYTDGSTMGLSPLGNNAKAFGFASDLGKNDKWYDSGSLTLTLAWNLTNMLPWSSNRQQVKDYRQQLAQLELAVESLKENQKVQVRKAVDTLNQAKQQIENMNRSVQLAQKAYDMQLRSYRSGTTELLDLRDSENSLNQAKLGQLNQKYQYISALMDLENTLNVKLTGESNSAVTK
ncbi:TolC family protein [uncultured Treponema sp.]|uniref:TolC family protein n=1 Tax=uncultured Treponema sp. TaxID=162155 RepID=UPI00258FD53E|nr:TolC family protein [uncultured Treponema sp.]